MELHFTLRQKLTLMNVYHEIRKNFVSTNLLSKEGFKIVIESNNIIISKNGMFVGKGLFL